MLQNLYPQNDKNMHTKTYYLKLETEKIILIKNKLKISISIIFFSNSFILACTWSLLSWRVNKVWVLFLWSKSSFRSLILASKAIFSSLLRSPCILLILLSSCWTAKSYIDVKQHFTHNRVIRLTLIYWDICII